MDEEKVNEAMSRDHGMLFVGLIFGALLVLIGDGHLNSAARPAQSFERSGTLIDATNSRGRYGINTTLIFENRYGEREAFEVKSSIKLREVGRIRARARALKGEKVIYAVTAPFEKLLSARTADGEEIVSRAHTLAAESFTGWLLAIVGFSTMITCFVCIAHKERKTR